MLDRWIESGLLAVLLQRAAIARRRGQSLARMALQWVLHDGRVTSALIGARDPAQLDDSLAALGDPPLAADELAEIERALAGA